MNKSLAILCSLGPSGVDPDELLSLADSAPISFFESPADEKFAKALVRFRLGKSEEAIDIWPTDAEYRTILSNVLLGVAHAKVGNAYSSRKYLAKGREQAERLLASPESQELT